MMIRSLFLVAPLISLYCTSALATQSIWQPPAFVANMGVNRGPLMVEAISIAGEPAFFYLTLDEDDFHHAVKFTERQGGTWVTSTVFFSPDNSHDPVSIAGGIVNGEPFVGVASRNTNSLKFFARPSQSWQEIYTKTVQGGVNAAGLSATESGGTIYGIIVDDPNARGVSIVEQQTPNWMTTTLRLGLIPDIEMVSAADVGGVPQMLISKGGGGTEQLYLGTKQGGSWTFSLVPSFNDFGKLAEWNHRPAFVSTDGEGSDPHSILFEYLDASNQWRQETITSYRVRGYDLDVVGGVPIVAYFDVENIIAPQLRVAVRNGSDWIDVPLDSSMNNWFGSIDVFELNGLPAIAYIDESTNDLYLITSVPEPAAGLLALFGLAAVVRNCRRPNYSSRPTE